MILNTHGIVFRCLENFLWAFEVTCVFQKLSEKGSLNMNETALEGTGTILSALISKQFSSFNKNLKIGDWLFAHKEKNYGF